MSDPGGGHSMISTSLLDMFEVTTFEPATLNPTLSFCLCHDEMAGPNLVRQGRMPIQANID